MKKISRRAFLHTATAGMSAAVLSQLSACVPDTEKSFTDAGTSVPASPVSTFTSVPPVPTLTPYSPPTATISQPTATVPSQPEVSAATPVDTTVSPTETATVAPVPTETATPTSVPDLVAARGGEPEELVRRAIAALGGIEKFVPRDARVVIKPNICTSYFTYEYAATTNPLVVAALVKLCLEAGAKTVQVFDYPFGGTMKDAYAKSGIAEAVKAAGGDMTMMIGYQYQEVEIPNGQSLKKTKAYKDVLNADVLINVPIAKHHSSTRLTLGMKNLMGIIANRNEIHMDLWHRIPDLASLFRPALTVVDAVRILTAHGPSGGSLDDVKKMDTVIASADFVAADAYATTTLFGIKAEDIPYIPAAAAAGLGRMDLGSLRIEEIAVGG